MMDLPPLRRARFPGVRSCFNSPYRIVQRGQRGADRRAVFAILLFASYLSGCVAMGTRGEDGGPEYPVGFREEGMASWYGPGFDGRRTASGERFDMHQLMAAHRTLPFGSMLRVRSLDSDRLVVVRVNDRGPFSRGRILDLSQAAAIQLGMIGQGTHRVELHVIASPATSDQDGGLWIQVASFVDRVQAHELIARLKASYSRVRVVTADLPVGTRYRVQVGPFTTERDASASADRIDREFQVESLVVRQKMF